MKSRSNQTVANTSRLTEFGPILAVDVERKVAPALAVASVRKHQTVGTEFLGELKRVALVITIALHAVGEQSVLLRAIAVLAESCISKTVRNIIHRFFFKWRSNTVPEAARTRRAKNNLSIFCRFQQSLHCGQLQNNGCESKSSCSHRELDSSCES